MKASKEKEGLKKNKGMKKNEAQHPRVEVFPNWKEIAVEVHFRKSPHFFGTLAKTLRLILAMWEKV